MHNPRLIKRLRKQYFIGCDTDVDSACERLLQCIKAYSCRLKRYNTRNLKLHQNRLFCNNQRQFYRNLVNNQQSTPLPPINDTVEFWRNVWSNKHEIDLKYVTEIESMVRPSNCKMNVCRISPEVFKTVIAKIKNWATPGMDHLHGYWLKSFTAVHSHMLDYFNHLISSAGTDIPSWLLKGRTTLLLKDEKKGPVPGNYRPITCLSTMWKLFSKMISELLYHHL